MPREVLCEKAELALGFVSLLGGGAATGATAAAAPLLDYDGAADAPALRARLAGGDAGEGGGGGAAAAAAAADREAGGRARAEAAQAETEGVLVPGYTEAALDDLADEVTYLWMPTQRRVAVHR